MKSGWSRVFFRCLPCWSGLISLNSELNNPLLKPREVDLLGVWAACSNYRPFQLGFVALASNEDLLVFEGLLRFNTYQYCLTWDYIFPNQTRSKTDVWGRAKQINAPYMSSLTASKNMFDMKMAINICKIIALYTLWMMKQTRMVAGRNMTSCNVKIWERRLKQ